MTNYEVWYMRPEFVVDGMMGVDWLRERNQLPTIAMLTATHIFLKVVEATDHEHLFLLMQGEHWSPNGEARPIIQAKGLTHTSMSVGDVAIERGDTSVRGFICDRFGWVKLTQGVTEGQRASRLASARVADRIDGYDRDDLGESPDY